MQGEYRSGMPYRDPQNGFEVMYDEWGPWHSTSRGPVLDSWDEQTERAALAVATELEIDVRRHPCARAADT